MITSRIDFLAIVLAQQCNPNGDPLASNAPRTDENGYGMISDVCIKRKIRNRMQDMGKEILLISEERVDDGLYSVHDRLKASGMGKQFEKDSTGFCKAACEKWLDVRTFGQVIAYKGDGNGVSIGIRGPVTVQHAYTIEPVWGETIEIIKSLNVEKAGKKDNQRIGLKYKISKGVYVIKGSINYSLAEKTGFDNDDANVIKECLKTLFENDESSSRPAGSMTVCELFWWEHLGSHHGLYPPLKVFNSLDITSSEEFPYYRIEKRYDLFDLKCEHYNPFGDCDNSQDIV